MENETSFVETVELFINEIMADNDSTIEDPDEAGAFEDWVEFYNPGSTSIDLSGFYLTDDSSDPTQWQFPTGSTIAAGGYLIIWADIASFTATPTFAWTAIPNAPGYQLFIRTSDGDTVVDDISTNSYTPSTVLSQSSGRWWIRSSDAIGNRGWSLAGTLGTRTEIIAAVGVQSTTQPTFSWIETQGAGRYILHVTNLDTNTVSIREDNLTTASYVPTAALSSGNYRAWVKAIDGTTDLYSSGVWSQSVDFSIAVSESPIEEELSPVARLASLLDPMTEQSEVRETRVARIEVAEITQSPEGLSEADRMAKRPFNSSEAVLDLCMSEFSTLAADMGV